MKKAIMALIALGATVVANAAAISWSITSNKTYEGYSVYLTTVNSFKSMDDVTANLLGTSGNTGSLGLATATARNATAAGSALGLDAETGYDFYYVFVNDKKDYWVSSVQSLTTNAETAAAAKSTFSATAANALLGGSSAGNLSVPEPTSGLLLLLGMAGLALKRKVA